MDNIITPLNIKTLFNEGHYTIPIYQRNYAWGNREITQLIQDIIDYAVKKPDSNYYIGSLIVYERRIDNKTSYETIDGQQRLTTLNILLSVVKRVYAKEKNLDIPNWFKSNLSFQSRNVSTETLQTIYSDTREIVYQDYKTYNGAIQQGYEDAETALKKILEENSHKLTFTQFYNYLKNRVFILRVPVPHDTDLNHYFEIMNSRGEQLEKHEVLKAHMLEAIKDDKDLSFAFHTIWEACSDMERYVQYGFTVNQRNLIFKVDDWNTLKFSDLYTLSRELAALNQSNLKEEENELTISEILEYKGAFIHQPDQKEDAPERFNTVINFSNFLLHVLRIQTKKDISLDDKSLLDIFGKYLRKDEIEVREFVKEFGFNLLKIKHLFDKYIIKREFLKDKDQWSLKRLKWYQGNKVSYVNSFGDENSDESENKAILMLLAMFHVSTPTLVYKHWLNAALKFVFYNEGISSASYLTYLETLAQAFLFNRFLAKEPQEYFNIIYTNDGAIAGIEEDESKLNRGTDVENFVFNYLDYLLWKRNEDGAKEFEFSFRSSVEHYYPQNPIAGNSKIGHDWLHHFGNLCLISSSKNSKLSNHMPQAKKDYYVREGIDSIKQRLMMNKANWNEEEIKKHGERMKEILFAGPINS